MDSSFAADGGSGLLILKYGRPGVPDEMHRIIKKRAFTAHGGRKSLITGAELRDLLMSDRVPDHEVAVVRFFDHEEGGFMMLEDAHSFPLGANKTIIKLQIPAIGIDPEASVRYSPTSTGPAAPSMALSARGLSPVMPADSAMRNAALAEIADKQAVAAQQARLSVQEKVLALDQRLNQHHLFQEVHDIFSSRIDGLERDLLHARSSLEHEVALRTQLEVDMAEVTARVQARQPNVGTDPATQGNTQMGVVLKSLLERVAMLEEGRAMERANSSREVVEACSRELKQLENTVYLDMNAEIKARKEMDSTVMRMMSDLQMVQQKDMEERRAGGAMDAEAERARNAEMVKEVAQEMARVTALVMDEKKMRDNQVNQLNGQLEREKILREETENQFMKMLEDMCARMQKEVFGLAQGL